MMLVPLTKIDSLTVVGIKVDPTARVVTSARIFVMRITRVPAVPGASIGTPDQLRAFYDAYYRPERTVIAVVGDIDPAAVEAKIKSVFSDWQGRGRAGHDDPGPYQPTGRLRRSSAWQSPATAPPTPSSERDLAR